MPNQAPSIGAFKPGYSISGITTRVSTDAAGTESDSFSFLPAFSPDGSKIAFISNALNLVGDANGVVHVFVKDLTTGAVTLVSTDGGGVQGNAQSTRVVFSPDGSKIAFSSNATNLVPGDTNNRTDIFVKDLATGAITRVSTDAASVQGNDDSDNAVFSPDGTKIAFISYASNLAAGDNNSNQDIFVKDLATGTIELVSSTVAHAPGNVGSYLPVFSPDGSKIAFISNASNLVAGDANGVPDVFVKDLTTGTVTLVSTTGGGIQADAQSNQAVFSPDGSKIAFSSDATNLVPGDTNNRTDLFVKDLTTGAITRVNVDAAGGQINGYAVSPAFSPDGSSIAFISDATNLVAGDTNNWPDIFIKDLTTGAVTRVTVSDAGVQSDRLSSYPVFSPDGSKFMYASDATNLVAGDTNGVTDIFVTNLTPLPEDPAAYVENAAAVRVNTRPVTVSDVDNSAFAGGSLTAALTAGSHAGDGLTLIVSGTPGTGIEISGTAVSYNGTAIGTLSGSGTNLSVALNASADVAAVEALASAVGFSSGSDDPTTDTRTVTFTLVDGSGGADTGSFAQTVLVTPVNDAPVNTVPAGPFTTQADTDLVISGLSISDIDATTLTTFLHVDHGTLTVGTGNAAVSGNGTGTVILTGTPAQINATFAAANHVVYHGTAGYVGTDILAVFTNDGTGGQMIDADIVSITNVAPAPVQLATNDFNGDGKSDIVWRNDAGVTAIWDMNNTAILHGNSLGLVPTNWHIAGTGDFNGDGMSDLLWRNDAGVTAIWDMNDGVILNGISLGPTNWHVAGTGDFNGDHMSDIVWRNDDGVVAIWDMNDGTMIQDHSLGVVPLNWNIAGIGDFNGDGKSDFLWRNDAGVVAIWDMNGGAIVGGGAVASVPSNWHIEGTGDFNGDHKSDILWRNDAGLVAVWDMNDTTIIGGGAVASAPANWHIANTGDYNGDGMSDILWRNDAGVAAIWDLNDTTIVGGGAVAAVPANWHIIV